MDQRHFKQTVIQLHIFSCDVFEPSHVTGISDHFIDELSFKLPFCAAFYFQPVCRHIKNPLSRFQNIRQMSQHIFQLLVRLVGNIGKQAKGRYIDKIFIVETQIPKA